MSEHRIDPVRHCQHGGVESADYSTRHPVRLNADIDLAMDAAPAYGGNTHCANPAQALAFAPSSCHMVTFLALASRAEWPIRSCADHAVTSLERASDGRMTVESIEGNPSGVLADNGAVSTDDPTRMHEHAHRHCFTVNALNLEARINPSWG